MQRTSRPTSRKAVTRRSATGSACAPSTTARSTATSSAVSADYRVAVSERLLEDEDGPMLDLLKGFHGTTIELPSNRRLRPDPERLAARFERFLATSGA